MHTYRATDAARIAPYLTHAVNHHGQVTLVPPDNEGRIRQGKPPKNRSRQRQERNTRNEDEPKFNTGPGPLQNLVYNRGARRPMGRQDRIRDGVYGVEEDYPDYPPPSFLEATSSVPTPEAFMSNATLPLVSQPTSPTVMDRPSDISSPPASYLPVSQPVSWPPSTRTLNDIDSDLSSLEVIDPESENIPSSSLVEENSSCGVTSSAPTDNPSRGRLSSRHATHGAAELVEGTRKTSEPETPLPSTKRKNKTLSPLRTLLPHRSIVTNDRPFSAHPSPKTSPYASKSPMPFLSATSLKLTTSSTPFAPSRTENFISRKLVSLKGKWRAKESLDTWEIVSSEIPSSFSLAAASMDSEESIITQASPTRSQSFTYGASTPTDRSLGAQTSPSTPTTHSPPHPLSLRDRKVPITPVPRRPKRDAPTVLQPVVAPAPIGPIITSVRTRIPPAQQSKDKQQAILSPLGSQSWRASTIELETESNAVLQRAIVTPLPLTPTDPPNDLATSAWRATDTVATQYTEIAYPPNCSTETEVASESGAQNLSDSGISGDCTGQSWASTNGAGDLLSDDHSINGRRHYPGRPLPLPPCPVPTLTGSPSAPQESATIHDDSGCLEGLLIDLEDVTTVENPTLCSNTNRDRNFAAQALTTRSNSSVDLLGSIVDEPSPSSHAVPAAQALPVQTNPHVALSELTDLDVLASRIHEDETQNGSNYDALLLLSEFVGPATPVVNRSTADRTFPTSENLTKSVQPVSSNKPLLGNVEVERRRTTKDGRVKLKLVVLDAPVDKCGICLRQFKSGDLAQLESACRHAFHDKCLGKWLARSNTCPMCRVTLAAADL